jgi:hypothetical protein
MKWLAFIVSLSACEPIPFMHDDAGRAAHLSHTPMAVAFSCSFPESGKPAARAAIAYLDTYAPVFVERPCVEPDETTPYGSVVLEASDENPSTVETRGMLVYVSDPKGAVIRKVQDGRFILGATILLYRRWFDATPSQAESTVRHELAHVLGFEDNETGGLMSPPILVDLGQPRALSSEEKRDLSALYGAR